MAPAAEQEQTSALRYAHIDLLRGVALFGVLLVNAFSGFSTSIFAYMFTDQPVILAEFFEFRALSIFAFLFGVSTAMLAERHGRVFLARRYAALFAIGLAHITLIWNGDILACYAVCGFLLLPFVNWRPAVIAATALVLMSVPLIPGRMPARDAMKAHGIEALRVYATASWFDILRYRCDEAQHWILPLWISTVGLATGLMLLGIAVWKTGVLRDPGAHRRTLLLTFGGGAVLSVIDYAVRDGLSWPLSVVYASAVLLWLRPKWLPGVTAVGRMALTNYLVQSVVMTLIFYSYGLGLIGTLPGRTVTAIVVVLYAAQTQCSLYWLNRHQYGPAEWVWRHLTNGIQCISGI